MAIANKLRVLLGLEAWLRGCWTKEIGAARILDS